MGQPYFALLVTHRKVVPAAVVEVADTGDAYAVTIDDHPRHHRHFRPPRAIMRRRDRDPPHDDYEKYPRKTTDMLRRGNTQQAQTANAAKAAANVKRSAAHAR